MTYAAAWLQIYCAALGSMSDDLSAADADRHSCSSADLGMVSFNGRFPDAFTPDEILNPDKYS